MLGSDLLDLVVAIMENLGRSLPSRPFSSLRSECLIQHWSSLWPHLLQWLHFLSNLLFLLKFPFFPFQLMSAVMVLSCLMARYFRYSFKSLLMIVAEVISSCASRMLI